jgi:hypothetical protein
MNRLRMVEAKQKHLGTGRLGTIVRVEDFASPVSVDAGDYVLVMASEKPTVALSIKIARVWVDAGARYICAWGPDCEQVEESFDYASFLPEYGEELELVTTAHQNEPIEDALWFAFNCAKSVETGSGYRGRCRQQTDGLSGSGDEGKQRIRHRCPRPGKSG